MKTISLRQSEPLTIIWKRFIPFWLVGLIPAYFVAGYLSNFYSSLFQYILLSLIFQIMCGLLSHLLIDETLAGQAFNWRTEWTAILVLCLAAALAIATTLLVWQFPTLFNRRILFMNSSLRIIFGMLALPSMAGSAVLMQRLQRSDLHNLLQKTSLWMFIQRNLAGIILALFFFFTYFTLTQCINFPGYDTVDRFFDTDISEWLARLAFTTPDQFMARAVHPAILLFLRPLVELIAIFLRGDKFQAVFLLNSLTGASCVLLVWLIVKQISSNTPFSLIMAFLLGIGTPHLLLSSMIETYIYSAFALLLFVLLMQSNKTDLRYTIPVGILVFGITITNLIQTCILYVFKRPQLKVILNYVVAILAITLILNVIQIQIYPHSMAIYDPADLIFEQKYRVNLFEKTWMLPGRFLLMGRAILLYAIVAPKPFILTTEIGTTFPTFSVFKITIGEFHVAGYTGISDLTVKFWMLILFVACVRFVWDLFKSPRQMSLPLAFVACMGFNLLLHTFWGDDPMLYSPDWAYAVVLFVAYALQKWANNKWFQVTLTVLLCLIMSVNLNLIYLIMQTSLPFYGK